VADVAGDGTVTEVAVRGVHLALADGLARHGPLRARKIAEAADVARRFARAATRHGVARCETIVTAPGRGPGGHRLTAALADSTGWPTRVLAADEEGRLAYDGAIARSGDLPEVVAVVDVGGGSSEIVVGTPLLGAAWVRSLTTGSLHLTRLVLGEQPSQAKIDAAREMVRTALANAEPPRPDCALASGGSARAVARLIGSPFEPEALDEAVAVASRRTVEQLARTFALRRARAETLAAGAIVLGETARLLGRPLELARGGLREGAALALAAAHAKAKAAEAA
jgi:exopolyphosphatase / guanosine-5'-triphosphate,3'-diphosphate pyrophosphatase